ncbi:MAG: hypothetical protein QM676_03075 [Novosphingobium sp.]
MIGDAAWGRGLAELVQALPGAAADDQAALLRKGFGAIADAAALNPAFFADLPSTQRFETLLASGAFESAAVAVIPAHAGYMLSRGGNGRHIGSVFMTGCGEHTVEGNTAALSIMAAMLSACHALLTLQTGPGELLN